MPLSIFDIDDLSFFRTLALALRHVGLEQGLRERECGSRRGDAVSLANYGISEDISEQKIELTTAHCEDFQRKVEKFIRQSFLPPYHYPFGQYQDAAFLILARGSAVSPYDFHHYPLGKCGSYGFTKEMILLFIKTDQYDNDNIEHAAQNVMMELKAALRDFKIQHVETMLTKKLVQNDVLNNKIQAILIRLLDLYRKNIFIGRNIFERLDKIIRAEQNVNSLLKSVEDDIQSIKLDEFKGENTIEVQYTRPDYEKMSHDQLLSMVNANIDNQKLALLQSCLKYLPKTIFSDHKLNPLLRAAGYVDSAISAVIYQHDTEYFMRILNDKTQFSPLGAAVRWMHVKQVDFFLSLKAVEPHDLILENGKHAFYLPAYAGSQQAYDVIKAVMNHQTDIGNQIKELDKNAVAACATSTGDKASEIMALLLPYADYYSKYLGLISATHELFYCYKAQNDDPQYYTEDLAKYQNLRNQIIRSLTPEECKEISDLHAKKTFGYFEGEEILQSDLLKTTLKSARQQCDAILETNILRCFGAQAPQQNQPLSMPFWQSTADAKQNNTTGDTPALSENDKANAFV